MYQKCLKTVKKEVGRIRPTAAERVKAMWNTLSVQGSAREIASVALSAERERHTGCVSPRLKLILKKAHFLNKQNIYMSCNKPLLIHCYNIFLHKYTNYDFKFIYLELLESSIYGISKVVLCLLEDWNFIFIGRNNVEIRGSRKETRKVFFAFKLFMDSISSVIKLKET